MDGQAVPRYAGPDTFARLPRRDEVSDCDVAILGVPFDSGVSYRPGARFGPSGVRHASKLLRPYHPGLDVSPFDEQQVADAGDVACNPFDIVEAIGQIERAAGEALVGATHLVAIGGDHTIALPMLRAVKASAGEPVAVVHFDAHVDTWDTYFGAAYTHGTPFRRASEEGLIAKGHSVHVGARSTMYSRADLTDDETLGFTLISSMDVGERGPAQIVAEVAGLVGDRPVYVSIDIDVLDPAFAPGTGTPEAGGLSSRELLATLRSLRDLPIVAADVVEVAPAYDHAEITSVAASHVIYELISLFAAAGRPSGFTP